MKDVVKKNIVAIMCLFCACLYLILCTSACINVEYFLEVGVYLSQGRFQTTLQITKQLQWRRQCSKEKTKVEEEGVIGKCADSVNRARKSYDECFNNLLYVFVQWQLFKPALYCKVTSQYVVLALFVYKLSYLNHCLISLPTKGHRLEN